jgi:kynurenine formamidase
VGDRAYNGYALADIVEDYGTNRLGIETLPQVVTRGLLVDVAALQGVERLQPGEVITFEETQAALAADGLSVRPGDAVFFHTGWGTLWGADNEGYAAAEPGPGVDLGAWLAEQRIALTGADTWSYGAYPPEDPAAPFIVPQTLNVRHGVVVVENLRLDDIARKSIHEFLLVISHAKLRGATGAWVAPLAIV